MANSDLQNSYGPEMAPDGHDLPQTVPAHGLEAMPNGHQHPIAPPYNEQHAKNNEYNPQQFEDPSRKRRVLGLPVVAFWGVIVGLVLILAIGLGVGLGVGLSQRNSSGESAATAEATTSGSADAATTSSASSATASTTSSRTITSTASATSAAATARNVEICNQASLVTDCTNLTVPVNTCSMSPYPLGPLQVAVDQRILLLTLSVNFPSAYNDSVSSVDTGGPECDFYTYVSLSTYFNCLPFKRQSCHYG